MINKLPFFTIIIFLFINACTITKNDNTQKAKSFKGYSTGNHTFEKKSNITESLKKNSQLEKEKAVLFKKKETNKTKINKQAVNKKTLKSLNRIIDVIENANINNDCTIEKEEGDLKLEPKNKKIEPLGFAGFISSLIPFLSSVLSIAIPSAVGTFFFLGYISLLITGVVAFVFGIISLSKIKKNPEKIKGKSFAITSLIIGAINLFAWFIISLALILVLIALI